MASWTDFFNPTLNHKSAEVCAVRQNVLVRATTLEKCAWECVSVYTIQKQFYTLWFVSQYQVALSLCSFTFAQGDCWDIRWCSLGRLPQWLRRRRIPPTRASGRWPCPWWQQWQLFCIGFWGLFGHVLSFPLYNLSVFSVFFGRYGVAVCARVCRSFCRELFRSKARRDSLVICGSVKFIHVGLRVSLFVHAHLILLVLEVALHDRSAIVLLREIQLISCFFEFLWFCRVSITSTSLSSVLNLWIPGTYMVNRLLVRRSACFLTSSAMPCGIFSSSTAWSLLFEAIALLVHYYSWFVNWSCPIDRPLSRCRISRTQKWEETNLSRAFQTWSSCP